MRERGADPTHTNDPTLHLNFNVNGTRDTGRKVAWSAYNKQRGASEPKYAEKCSCAGATRFAMPMEEIRRRVVPTKRHQVITFRESTLRGSCSISRTFEGHRSRALVSRSVYRLADNVSRCLCDLSRHDPSLPAGGDVARKFSKREYVTTIRLF